MRTARRGWRRPAALGLLLVAGTLFVAAGAAGAGQLHGPEVSRRPLDGSPMRPDVAPGAPHLNDDPGRVARESERRLRQEARLLLVAPVVGWLLFLAMWWRWGKEPPAPDDVGRYVVELPDDPPAVASSLLHYGAVRPPAFSATVVDLAQRGFLTIEERRVDRRLLPDRADWTLRKVRPAEGLRHWEEALLDHLFALGLWVTQSALTHWARQHPVDARKVWDAFTKGVRTEVERRSYVERRPLWIFVLNMAVAVGVLLAGMGSLDGHQPLGALTIASALGQMVATKTLSRRTAAGARRAAEWAGVRRYLHDFSTLSDAPIGHLVLWERYFVYAVALDVADRFANALALRVPGDSRTRRPVFGSWYLGGPADDGHRLASVHRFAAGFGPSLHQAYVVTGGGGLSQRRLSR